MTRPELELFVQPWYHDFADLGLPTPQRPGAFPLNQAAKQAPLLRLVDEALATARTGAAPPTVLDLFCGDGFYSIYAAQQGASHVVGIDLDDTEIAKARLVTRLLGLTNVQLRVEDVLSSEARATVGICAGGLYHVSDPAAVLARLATRIERVLVIQTVFHMGRTESDYLETPAPGWTWGCRFSWEHLLEMTERSGWRVVHAERNELLGNVSPEHRGSAYLLCVPATPGT
jgi:SAM-dependent methyltransferase